MPIGRYGGYSSVNHEPHHIEPEIDFGNDRFPEIESEAEVKILEVMGSETHEGVLQYTILLSDKLNLKQPMAFELQVTSDGIRLLMVAQTPLEQFGRPQDEEAIRAVMPSYDLWREQQEQRWLEESRKRK